MPAPPLIADRYELKEPLGEGGMGIVYRAYDLKTKSFVAIKTMRDASDPVAVELFSKEWGVLASLSHPNIVDIRDVGEIEEHGQKKPFFVMPLLPGVPLSELIESSSARLTVDRVIYIIFQVCRGLHAAHERGLVHRDIKPTNIYVMEDDTAKIIDFGVVYLAGSQSVTGLKGTWQYMAPEQVDLKPASPVSDIFSLGVVCYEALTGRRPFARKTPGEIAEAIRNYIPPPICEINPSVSQLVSMAIHKAMAKQAIHRYPSARDFGDTLQKAYHNEPIERFDRVKIQPRIERAKKAFQGGDSDFASEILTELEVEGHIDPEIALVRDKIDQARRQKKIRSLLEAARTRLEQDEIPLALEKLKEVLEIDPENTDALALRASVEKQRNERQIESWMSLAQRHLDRHDFPEARQALGEVLKIRSSDPAALDLLNQIQRREQDTIRVRNEKEQLYGAARKDYQNGEISTALSKLERLLDLGGQTGATLPDREAVYQGFYNQVRSDRDSIHNAYEEARRHLADRNFARALQICDEFITKYPSDALFQALKLEAVEQQRQELSAFIVEIGHRLDAEADLDRKVNILKEACERYPNEQQFQQSLKLTRERRDLVLSIVTKARYFEEKGLFTEAIGQWDILRNIYSRYPGIDIEVTQLKKRRDEQARDEAKARLVEQIDRALDSGDFSRACDLSASALAEYPEDQELTGLERLARQGLERSQEAGKLCTQAQELLGQQRTEEAIASLRLALELDPKGRAAREALVSLLVEQARPLAEGGDWRKAETLVQQASDLDAAHSATRTLRTLIGDAKRKEFVSQCLSEARDLQLQGNLESALAKIEAGLAQYANEPRLVQLQTTLQNMLRDSRRQKERAGDLESLRAISQTFTQSAAKPALLGSELERAQAISRKHPDDPEIGSLVAEIRQRAGTQADLTETVAQSDGSIFQPTVSSTATVLQGTAAESQGAGAAAQPARTPAQTSQPAAPPRPAGPARTKQPSPLPALLAGLSRYQLAMIGGVVFLIIAAIVAGTFKKGTKAPVAPAVTEMAVEIRTTPPDATVTVNGEARTGTIQLPSKGTYSVVVSRLGYRTDQETIQPQAHWNFTLDPAPIHLNLSTSEKAGKVFLDENEKGDLQAGPLQDLELPVDGNNHVLALRNGNKEILSLSFSGKPGELARVINLKSKDLIVVSSLGNEATVYSGSATLRANLTGQELQPIPPEGLTLKGVSASANELAFSNTDLPKIPIETGNAPALYVGLNADTNIAWVSIQSNVPAAQLFMDGSEIKPSKPGVWRPLGRKPGKYTLLMKAEGYEERQEQVELVKGKTMQVAWELKPMVSAAYLAVEGGTPGAQVVIDGVAGNSLNSSGSARIEVSPGTHRISFRKELFEPSAEVPQNFSRGQEIKLGAAEAKLKEYGTLQFRISPPNAQVTYHRGDQGPQRVQGESARVPEGRYSVTAEAPGYKQDTREYTVAPGQSANVEFALVAVVAPAGGKTTVTAGTAPAPSKSIDTLFENPGQIMQVGDWWRSMLPVEYIFLKPGVLHQFNLAFSDPGKNFARRQKKVEWVLGYIDARNKVVYEFDGRKLDRKAFVNGKQVKASVTCEAGEGAFQFQISIRSNQITVESPKCDTAESYESNERDLTTGKIGIKPNTEFVIR